MVHIVPFIQNMDFSRENQCFIQNFQNFLWYKSHNCVPLAMDLIHPSSWSLGIVRPHKCHETSAGIFQLCKLLSRPSQTPKFDACVSRGVNKLFRSVPALMLIGCVVWWRSSYWLKWHTLSHAIKLICKLILQKLICCQQWVHQLLYKKFLTFLTGIMERMVNFSQYCTVLAEPGRTLSNCYENPRAARNRLWC